jgi:hypothetical protein
MTEITRKGLWEFFVGTANIVEFQCRCGKVYFSVRRYGADPDSRATFHSIKLSDLDDIEKIFVGILQFLPLANHLLQILWIREEKFEMAPPKEKDILGLALSSPTLVNTAKDVKSVMDKFRSLLLDGFLQKTISNEEPEDDSENDVMIYPLTAKGKNAAEDMFENAKKVVSAYIDPMPIVSEADIATYPRVIQAASRGGYKKAGKTTAEKAYQKSIEWTSRSSDVTLIFAPAEREALGEAVGRNVAKWFLKMDMSKANSEFQEEILSDMGFEPVEIVEKLYPNVDGNKRRKHAQRISKNKSKRNKKP